jgi:hypothetical protein
VAVEVLEKGVEHQDRVTQNVSKTSLGLMRGEITIKPPRRKPKPYGKRPQSKAPQSRAPQSKAPQSKREIRSVPSEPNGNLKSYAPKPTRRPR